MAQSASERRAAQRRLASEIRSGTYKPSSLGRTARETPKVKAELKALKEAWYGNSARWNKKRSDKAVDKASSRQAKKALDEITHWIDVPQDYDPEDVDEDIEGILYYH